MIWLKYFIDVNTLGSQCVHSILWLNLLKNRPEDDYLLVETCSLHITLCNKNSCADVQISITIRIQALHDVFIKIHMKFSEVEVSFPKGHYCTPLLQRNR